jgi:hypothetical protein
MSAEKTPFSQQIAFMSKGMLDDELTEVLAEVVRAVRETGKQGTVSLNLKIGMLNRADENTMKITPTITHKAPEADRAEAIMWSTADGDLLRNDPDQRALDLREVETRNEQDARAVTDTPRIVRNA